MVALYFKDNDAEVASISARLTDHSPNNAQLRFSTTSAGTTRERIIISELGHIIPTVNNSLQLGTTSYKWSQVHTNNLYASGASVLGASLQLNNSGKLQFAGTDTYILGNAQYDYIQIIPNAATADIHLIIDWIWDRL